MVGVFPLHLARGVFGLILDDAILLNQEHKLIPSRNQAGFISLRGLLFRVSFFAVSPVVGWGVEMFGEHDLLVTFGSTMTALNALALWWWWRVTRSVQPAVVELIRK